MNYIVLCECAKGPDRRIVAWINDLRPTQKHVSLTGTSGFKAKRRRHRTKAGSGWLYTMSCPDCKQNVPLSESRATAIVDWFKSVAERLQLEETVVAPNPPDIGVPRPGWHATADDPESRHVIGFKMLQEINSELGKRGVK